MDPSIHSPSGHGGLGGGLSHPDSPTSSVPHSTAASPSSASVSASASAATAAAGAAESASTGPGYSLIKLERVIREIYLPTIENSGNNNADATSSTGGADSTAFGEPSDPNTSGAAPASAKKKPLGVPAPPKKAAPATTDSSSTESKADDASASVADGDAETAAATTATATATRASGRRRGAAAGSAGAGAAGGAAGSGDGERASDATDHLRYVSLLFTKQNMYC